MYFVARKYAETIVSCHPMGHTLQTFNKHKQADKSQRFAKIKEVQANIQTDTIAPHLFLP
jgi:hypothetical protein